MSPIAEVEPSNITVEDASILHHMVLNTQSGDTREVGTYVEGDKEDMHTVGDTVHGGVHVDGENRNTVDVPPRHVSAYEENDIVAATVVMDQCHSFSRAIVIPS